MEALPFEEDEETAEQLSVRTFALARKHGLTIYDAAYLELAQRRNATLATFDTQLLKAAGKEGVPVPSAESAKTWPATVRSDAKSVEPDAQRVTLLLAPDE